MLRVTITINSRATLSLGFAFSGDASSNAVIRGSGNQGAQGQRTVFILLKRHLLLALFFRKIQVFSQLRPASPALTETSVQPSEKCSYRMYLLWGRVAHMVHKNITLKWCFRFDANIAKRVRDRDSHCLLQTCIVLFTISQSIGMIPPFQDASWCLQGCQTERK